MAAAILVEQGANLILELDAVPLIGLAEIPHQASFGQPTHVDTAQDVLVALVLLNRGRTLLAHCDSMLLVVVAVVGETQS